MPYSHVGRLHVTFILGVGGSASIILDCKNLVRKLERQSFNIAALRKRFEVFVDKYFNIWGKFGVNLTSEHVF